MPQETEYRYLAEEYFRLFQEAHDARKYARAHEVADALYDIYVQMYDEEDEQGQKDICYTIDRDILPYLDDCVLRLDNVKAEKCLVLRRLYFALSARRCLKNFAFYIEQYKTKKVWDKTYETMSSFFFYLDKFSVEKHFTLIRASMMPSMGKSYIANLYVAQSIGNNPNVQILRITYSDDLCITTNNQTAGIINSQAFREIFPRYNQYAGEKIFRVRNSYQLCIADCEDEYNLNSVTRDGQSTGKRCQLLIIDDLLKGEIESLSKSLHAQLKKRYDSDWKSRAGDDSLKIMLLGTMWADTDLLNVVYDEETSEKEFTFDSKHRYTEIAKDGSSCFIGIPALDYNDKSTCPKRYSTETLHRIRKNMDKYLWQCVYQQQPIAPEGLSFDYGLLTTYDVKQNKKGECRYATLDPARKGKNYVTMPICYQYAGESKFTLVDCLYQRKSMRELYDDIVNKIVEHRIQKLHLENNIDTSLKTVLEERLEQIGYTNCVISEVYSSENKEKRISNNQGDIRGQIIYPKKGLFSMSTDMGKFMNDFTSYSFEHPNAFDDAPDALCMFVQKFITSDLSFAKVTTFKRTEIPI